MSSVEYDADNVSWGTENTIIPPGRTFLTSVRNAPSGYSTCSSAEFEMTNIRPGVGQFLAEATHAVPLR
jgi:hypothetical protein